MNIGGIEITAKEITMETGKDQRVLILGHGYGIQGVDRSVPRGAKTHCIIRADFDILGIALRGQHFLSERTTGLGRGVYEGNDR